MIAEPQVRWKLPEVLEREGISIDQLNQELAKRVSRATLDKWGSATGPKRLDPEVVGWVLWALRRLTGKPYELSDLLEIKVPPEAIDASILARASNFLQPERGMKPVGSRRPAPQRGQQSGAEIIISERGDRF